MNVILREDIRGVGKKYEVKKVADGYARNFLIPKNQARLATPQAVRELARLKKDEVAHVKRVETLARTLNDRTLTFHLKTDENRSVFGSVTKEAILKGLRDAKLVTKERASIKLAHPLKQFGTHEVEVDLTHGITAKLKIIVQPQL